MVNNGTNTENTVENAQADVQEVLSEFGENFHEKANEARVEVVKHLRNLAKTVQENVREKTNNENVKAKDREQAIAKADEFADGLMKTARYLESHSVEEIEQEATATVKDNVWKSVLIAFLVGMILGIFIKRS